MRNNKLKPLVIGNITIKHPLALAPMAGVTDLPYRLLCKEQGAGMMCTEMVSAKGLYYGNRKSEPLMATDPKEFTEDCNNTFEKLIIVLWIPAGTPT